MNHESPIPLHLAAPPPSGAAMDRQVPVPRGRRWFKRGLAAAAVMAIGAIAVTLLPHGVSVRRTDVTVATVQRGEFHDDLVVRSEVQPAHSVLLDATDGGRVDAVLARDGDLVKQGALLAQLSNPQREQEVIARTADVAQQLSNLSMLRAALASTRAQQRRDLSGLEHDLAAAELQWQRQRRLHDQGFVSDAALEDAQLRVDLQRRWLHDAREDATAELRVRQQSVDDLERAIQGLTQGLALMRHAAENLAMRAPRDGRLTGFSLQVGASVRPGDRLGRIDDVQAVKLVAAVDEFYLPRVRAGLPGQAEIGGTPRPLKVLQVLPQIQNGRFTVELGFDGAMPGGLQAGQSVDVHVVLGRSTPALLLDDGPFYADTGGSSVYVLEADGRHAERRSVQLGRRAAGRIEVLAGLREGEQVIVSSVRGFRDAKTLALHD
jgi:HlyD family secretion protein